MITLMRLCWYKPRATNACPDSRRRLLMGGGQIGFSTFGGLLLHAMKRFTHTHFTLRYSRIQANNEKPPL